MKSERRRGRLKAKPTCFVLMPFSNDFDAVYENAIRPAIGPIRGLTCLRADEVYGPRPIMADIWRSIRQSLLLVADLTDRNPNVLYELGLGHAIQKPAVLIAQRIEDIPFDLRSIRCLLYKNDRVGRENLKVQLKQAISAFLLDHAKGIGQELAQYTVLAEHAQPKVSPGRISGRLRSFATKLSTSEPSKLLRTLNALAEAKDDTLSEQVDPQLITILLNHLASPFPEIRQAAVNCIETWGSTVHTHFLYPLIEDRNASIQCSVIRAIASNDDGNAEILFLDLLRTPSSESVRRALLDGLATVGTSRSIQYFTDVLRKDSEDTAAIREAVEVPVRDWYA